MGVHCAMSAACNWNCATETDLAVSLSFTRWPNKDAILHNQSELFCDVLSTVISEVV